MTSKTNLVTRALVLSGALGWASTASAHTLDAAFGEIDCDSGLVLIQFLGSGLDPTDSWSIEYALELNQSVVATGVVSGPAPEPGGTLTVDIAVPVGLQSGLNTAGGTATLYAPGLGDPNETLWNTIEIRDATGNPVSAVCGPPTASLGDFVFIDENGDGVQAPTDPGFAGVPVDLRLCDELGQFGLPIASTTTDLNGGYRFDNLTPGFTYGVTFGLPPGYSFTQQNVGLDDLDSDADPSGATACVTLGPGEFNPTLDAGLVLVPEACGLTVNKLCTIVTPPPAQPFGCDGKIDTLVMRYDGSFGTLQSVTAYAGAVGSTTLPVNINGDIVSVSGYQAAGAPNDVVWAFVGSTGSGSSTFHLSCSDGEMDGETDNAAFPNDCGRPQGDGKSNSSGVNAWTLEGLATDEGELLTCTPPTTTPTESCSFDAQEASCDSLPDKPDTLTFRYTGGGCSASDNDQKPGDATCSGRINPLLPVRASWKDGSTMVAVGATFDVPRDDAKEITLRNAGGTEELELHTSCSQPLITGDVYGSLTLQALDGVGMGRDVVYSYVIENTGSGPITGISLVDTPLGTITTNQSLMPGTSLSFEATAAISETTTNTVVATGQSAAPVCRAEDSLTVTVTPPPACVVSARFDKLEDGKIKYKVTNSGVRKATLGSLVLNFPSRYGRIKKVKFDGDVYKADDSPLSIGSGDTIGVGDWTESNVEKREIDSGKTEDLEIEFTRKVDKEVYEDIVSSTFSGSAGFTEGCSIDL